MPLKKIDDYPAFLESCWQEHLQPKPADAPTVISTFAGCGGSSLGYSMAGFRELLAVEWDDNAVETFGLNFPDVPVYHGDIAKLSVHQALRMTGLQPGQLDIFDGSPPCQGFSTAGKRRFDDDRNQLFKEYARLLRGLRPKVFVMENVSGMVKGVMKLVFVEILKELKASGYRVSARLLNAMYFGVPQSRQRMIFIGVRDDLGIEPSHPIAQNYTISVRQAFENMTEQTADRPMAEWMQRACSEIQGRDGTKDVARIFIKHKGTSGSAISTRRLLWDKPSKTIAKSEIAVSGLLHPQENRYLTLPELKRLSSFYDSYYFTNRADAIERIGNSVPPLFMRSIAQHIRHEILDNIAPPPMPA